MRQILPFFVVLALGLPVVACPPRYVSPVYHAPTYVAPVVAVYQPIPVAVPVFTVGYAPPPVLASSLTQPVAAAPVTPAVATPAPAAGTPAAQQPAAAAAPAGAGMVALNARCASCHEGNVAQSKGKGHVLLQGSALAPLTEAQRLAALREVLSGRMPRGGKLSDEEYGSILDVLSGEAK